MSSWTRVAVWMISTTAPSRTALRSSWGNSLALSSSSAGRRRLPPPARKCSPISVMARTLETVSRPNSRSMAARSSRRSSKTSFAPDVAGELKSPLWPRLALLPARPEWLVAPVIGELHVDPEIAPAQERDDLLQGVAVFAAHPDGIALNRCLDFFLRILDDPHNLFRFFCRDTLLHGDFLAHS